MSRNIPYRPLAIKLINSVGALLARVGIEPTLTADDIFKRVEKETGLKRPLPGWDAGGLDVLLNALNTEAQLNTVGRFGARGMLTNLISNYVKLTDWFDRHPEEVEQVIEKPIFIVICLALARQLCMG